jgi:DNA-binding transcriptional regulator YiaG
MPNIASILKAEISRVARREVRAEIETLKKASAQHRSSIAALRREVDQLQKELRRATKLSAQARPANDASATDNQEPPRRFSASRLAAHRGKLGLSAAAYGQLVGVAGQTIYNWEQGKARPRPAQLQMLASVRGLGRREVAERLEAS